MNDMKHEIKKIGKTFSILISGVELIAGIPTRPEAEAMVAVLKRKARV